MRRESIPYQMGPPRPLVRRSRRKARALVYIVALTKKEPRSKKKLSPCCHPTSLGTQSRAGLASLQGCPLGDLAREQIYDSAFSFRVLENLSSLSDTEVVPLRLLRR
jgi:hypothetical protein